MSKAQGNRPLAAPKSCQVHAMIVAAGSGSRFGAGIAKQYVTLFGKTLLEHSVTRLASSCHIKRCLLVISAHDQTASALNFPIPISVTTGGAERWQSVQSGLIALIKSGANDEDLVLIHDAARPLVATCDIDRVIEVAKSEPFGAILAAPVADTLKQAQSADLEQPYIAKTLDRSLIWQAQTPQVFRIGALRSALDHIAANHLMITDEASAFEALGQPIRLVAGSRQNIKMTYPDDGVIIEALLAKLY